MYDAATLAIGSIRTRALVGMLGLVGAACTGSPVAPTGNSPLASAVPSLGQTSAPTPPGGIVASGRYGYSLELPPGWVYRPATSDWPAHTYPAAGATYTDNWERLPGGFPVIDVSTQELPPDQTQDQFTGDLDEGNARVGCNVEATEEVAVDGNAGRFQRQACASGSEIALEVLVFDDNRVYLIYWIGLTEERAEDELAFRQILDTFRFAPDG